MAGQVSELERLELQARVWEPAGQDLLADIGAGTGKRVLDIGCGALGWLRLLSEWVGPTGRVVGTDIDRGLLDAAGGMIDREGLRNVELVSDDLFDSRLDPGSFDVLHSRFQLTPLGRAPEQLAAYQRLLAPGGLLVVEDPDAGSWHFNPPAPAAEQLIGLILRAFEAGGGNFDAGRTLPGLLTGIGLEPTVRASVRALPAGHPYLRVPLQFSVSLEPRLTELVSLDELVALRERAEAELAEAGRWGTTFTLIQAWGRMP